MIGKMGNPSKPRDPLAYTFRRSIDTTRGDEGKIELRHRERNIPKKGGLSRSFNPRKSIKLWGGRASTANMKKKQVNKGQGDSESWGGSGVRRNI